MSEFTQKERDSILRLLSSTGSIAQKYEFIAYETGANFNIFDAAGIASKEERISCVLAELLSPQGSHGQASIFLELFFDICLKALKKKFLEADIKKAEVILEHHAGMRRIDIVIKIRGKLIPIEVKINAEDQRLQCYDYWDYAKSKNNDENTQIVYLTKFGDFPSDDSRGNLKDDDIFCLSFSHDILTWLKACLSVTNVLRKAPIREVLLQLESTIKKFTNQLEDRALSEVKNVISKSAQDMRNADIIADSINEAKIAKTIKLFEAIDSEIEKRLCIKRINSRYFEKDNIREHYEKGKAKKYASLNYLLATVNPETKTDIWLRIELNYEWMSAGKVVAVENENKGWKLSTSEEYRFNMSCNDNVDDWWSKDWFYLPSENNRPNFRKPHNDCFYSLFDESSFDEFVAKSADLIEEKWLEWKEQMKYYETR